MLLSQQPRKVPLAFAENGEKTTIPKEDSPFAGKASLNVGFPPLTRTALDDGGIPPDGLDMNGILYLMSLINRWQSASGSFVYDSTFANDTNVAGYPKGAVLLRADGTGFWLNQTDANTTNPDTGGANWQPINNVGTAIVTTTGGNVTMTALQYARDVIVVSGALTSNTNIIFPNIVKQWLVFNATTGAYTVTAKTAAGAGITINNGSNTPRIIYCDITDCYGVNPLRSTQAQVDAGTDEYTFLTPKTFKDSQELADKADKNGNLSNIFSAANGASGKNVVNVDQLNAVAGSIPAAPVQATETQIGVVEIATNAELLAGVSDTVAVTPLKARLGFSVSLGVNGHISFPTWMGGFRMQWGKKTQSTYGEATVMTFPNNCYGVWASIESAGNVKAFTVSSVSSTSFSLSSDYYNGNTFINTPSTFWWLAVGD